VSISTAPRTVNFVNLCLQTEQSRLNADLKVRELVLAEPSSSFLQCCADSSADQYIW